MDMHLAPPGTDGLTQAPPVVFICGAPRSGTTWLGKIFDSHPDVLYRNEPDTVLREKRLPRFCDAGDVDEYAAIAREYVARLADVRTIRAAGSLPVFPKSFGLPLAHPLRQAVIYGLHAAAELGAIAGWANGFAIPDMARRGAARTLVFKSTNARGLARLYHDAIPGSRIVLIVRHPGGQVGSVMRGLKTGQFAPPERAEVLQTDQARQLGLTEERFAALSPVEQFVWHWAILNQKAADDLAGSPRARVLIYEELAHDPPAQVRDIFAFAGLEWNAQTERFIGHSTTSTGADRYYSVRRNPQEAADKWRSEVSPEDQQRIVAIARQVPVGRLFADIAAA